MPLVMFRWWERMARKHDVYTELNLMEATRAAYHEKDKPFNERMTGGIRECKDLDAGITQEEKYERNFQEFVRRARGGK